MVEKFNANGKFLLSGEYLVLEGALALALPLKMGQCMEVVTIPSEKNSISWNGFYWDKNWFYADFTIVENMVKLVGTDNIPIAERLESTLNTAFEMADFIPEAKQVIKTTMNFDPSWGLGSSSTLIANLSRWLKIDPYQLLDHTFGGSGYDIACAYNSAPILFKKFNGKRIVSLSRFNPPFRKYLYFAYLGKKQNSAREVLNFKQIWKKDNIVVHDISQLTREIEASTTLDVFEYHIKEHERILSSVLGKPTIYSLFFNGFIGTVKSLGGWGGDFVLLTWKNVREDLEYYLRNKGINIVFSYDEIVL